MMPFTVSSCTLKDSSISLIFKRCIESNALEKSTKSIVAGRCFPFTHSMMRRMVRICPDVDLFWRNPFWFRRRIGST